MELRTQDAKATTAHDVRGDLRDDDEAIRLMDHPDSDEEIPTLDIAAYLAGQPGGREAAAAKLREVSRTVGFFYLKGHGIPQELIDRVFEQSRRFHALPIETKTKIPYFDTGSFKSGYQPCTKDDYQRTNINIINDAKPNLNAKFSINREGGSGGLSMSEEQRKARVNIWPENLPGFKETVSDYHARIEKLGRQFLPLWATSLKLPLDYFDKYFATPHMTMSLLHYPPQKEIGNRQYGIAPHTDNALMTFLAQKDIPGLAVRMPSGHWRAVEPVPRHASGQHRQPDGALDQRRISVDQASRDQHQHGRSLLDSGILRSERRCADRGAADLPEHRAPGALRADDLPAASRVVLRPA